MIVVKIVKSKHTTCWYHNHNILGEAIKVEEDPINIDYYKILESEYRRLAVVGINMTRIDRYIWVSDCIEISEIEPDTQIDFTNKEVTYI